DQNVSGMFGLRPGRQRCRGTALEAPFRIAPAANLIAQHPLADALAELLKAGTEQPAGAPPRLDDVVAYSPGLTRAVRILLLVPPRLRQSRRLVLRRFAAAGTPPREDATDGSGL